MALGFNGAIGGSNSANLWVQVGPRLESRLNATTKTLSLRSDLLLLAVLHTLETCIPISCKLEATVDVSNVRESAIANTSPSDSSSLAVARAQVDGLPRRPISRPNS